MYRLHYFVIYVYIYIYNYILLHSITLYILHNYYIYFTYLRHVMRTCTPTTILHAYLHTLNYISVYATVHQRQMCDCARVYFISAAACTLFTLTCEHLIWISSVTTFESLYVAYIWPHWGYTCQTLIYVQQSMPWEFKLYISTALSPLLPVTQPPVSANTSTCLQPLHPHLGQAQLCGGINKNSSTPCQCAPYALWMPNTLNSWS